AIPRRAVIRVARHVGDGDGGTRKPAVSAGSGKAVGRGTDHEHVAEEVLVAAMVREDPFTALLEQLATHLQRVVFRAPGIDLRDHADDGRRGDAHQHDHDDHLDQGEALGAVRHGVVLTYPVTGAMATATEVPLKLRVYVVEVPLMTPPVVNGRPWLSNFVGLVPETARLTLF